MRHSIHAARHPGSQPVVTATSFQNQADPGLLTELGQSAVTRCCACGRQRVAPASQDSATVRTLAEATVAGGLAIRVRQAPLRTAAFSAVNSASVSAPPSCSRARRSSSATRLPPLPPAATGTAAGVARRASLGVPPADHVQRITGLDGWKLAGGLAAESVDTESEQDGERGDVAELAECGHGTHTTRSSNAANTVVYATAGRFTHRRRHRAPQRRAGARVTGEPGGSDEDCAEITITTAMSWTSSCRSSTRRGRRSLLDSFLTRLSTM